MDLGILEVTAKVRDKNGREDIVVVAMSLINANGQYIIGDELCNLIMKAKTKAKRRATLSLCGLSSFENESDELKTIEKRESQNAISENDINAVLALANKKRN